MKFGTRRLAMVLLGAAGVSVAGLAGAGAAESPRGRTADGAYVFPAAEARPLVEGLGFRLVESYRDVPGLTVVEVPAQRYLLGLPWHEGMYWRLDEFEPGAYWPGLVYESSAGELEGPAPSVALYLNGRVIQTTKMTRPEEAAPGCWFAELQASDAVALRPGDEIAVKFVPQQGCRVARLLLRQAEPEGSPYQAPLHHGGPYSTPGTATRVTIESVFVDARGNELAAAEPHFGQEQRTVGPDDLKAEDGRGRVRVRLSNPLPKAVVVEYTAQVRAHFGREAGARAGRETIPAHAAAVHMVDFELFADEPAYSCATTLRVVTPPDLGWPEADTVSLFPGFRQSLAWPDPFSSSNHRRVFFTDPVDAPHQRLRLDGQWEIGLTRDLNPPVPVPAAVVFEPCPVPARWSAAITDLTRVTPRAHGAYFRRTFDWPEVDRPRTVRLVVDSVVASARAYLNGVEVGSVRGERAPLVADVSAALRPGANELVVVVQDLLSVMNPEYVNPAAPVASVLYLDAAAGTFGRNNVAMDSVSLEIAPTVSAQDVMLIPSVRRDALGVRMRMVNSSADAVRARVSPVVMEHGRPVLELPARVLDLPARGGVDVEWDQPWPGATRWEPAAPHLYTLAVETVNVADGARLDLARERFGFRESWIEGPHIMFNGRPVKLKGATGSRPLGFRDNEFDLSRGSHAPHFTDETGLLVTEAITGVYNSSSTHNADRDAFWESARVNAVAAARRKWNHPSIIAWDLSNEWYGFLEYSGDDPMRAPRQMRSITDAVQAHDPTRWTFYNGDGDLAGLHDVFAGHYVVEGSRPHPISGFGFHGRSSTFPDGAFWRALEADFEPGQSLSMSYYRGKTFVKFGEKVVMNTENLWKVGRYMPPGLTKIAGEDAILSPAIDGASGPVVWFWKQNIDAHRDMGMSSVSSYVIGASYRRGYPRQLFIMPDTIHQGYAGDTWVRTYSLHNDLMRAATLTWRWRLQTAGGEVLAGEEERFEMPSAGLERGRWTLTLPGVEARTPFTLVFRLEEDGRLVYGEERDIEVWPRRAIAAGPLARRVHLYDRSGATAAALREAGVEFALRREWAAPDGADPARQLVIIGEDELDADTAGAVATFQDFVEAGGRLLILGQAVTPAGLPAATMLEPREWSSQPFVRLPTHPVLEGISSWDLHFWAPDRVSSRGAYAKPDRGSAIVLVDSGNDQGLEWTQLMELPRGAGSVLVCQLGVVRGRGAAPMAAELLARLLRYAGGLESSLPPARTLRSRMAAKGPLADRLAELGISHTPLAEDEDPAADAVLLVDPAVPATDAERERWAAAVRAGATLIVQDAAPGDASWLSVLAGTPVRIETPRRTMWTGRGYRCGFSPLTAGLSHADLYWKRFDGRESAGAQAQVPALALEPLQRYEASAASAVERVFPGALVECPVGQGRLILDQRRWTTTHERLAGLARRQAAALFRGVGVRVAPYAPPRPLPDEVRYRTIDLTPVANRALVDEVPEDGEGGFTDQGPDSDLRDLPTGRPRFGGVPFAIGEAPHSCVVLASASRPFPERFPKEATVPIGFVAEGFFFLHAAAYTRSESIALYEVLYEDGTVAEIPVRNELNLRDWIAAPGPFPREQDTRTAVAWSGRTPRWVNAVVYKTLWVNPRPEEPVRAIRFSNPDYAAVPVLIGVTAAVPVDEAQRAADVAFVRERIGAARAALGDGREAEAARLLREACAVEYAGLEAYPVLADRLERSAAEDELLAFYRDWIDAGSRVALPFNRVGEMLEKRGDLAGALSAYTRSLEVEWNQPPIIESKSRIERALSKPAP